MMIVAVLRSAGTMLLQFTARTQILIATSTRTSAGLSTRLTRKRRARGTVMEENPYPSAPLIRAAPKAIAASHSPWVGVSINGYTALSTHARDSLGSDSCV